MPFLILIAAAVAIVWGLLFASRASLLVNCFVYLIVAAIVGYDFLHFDVAGINLSIDRLMLMGLVGAFIVQLKYNRTVEKSMDTSDLLLIASFGWLLLNTFIHGTGSTDPNQVPILPHLIEGYLIPLLLFSIACRAPITDQTVRWCYGLMGGFGVYLCITAFCEIMGLWGFVFPKTIQDPSLGIHFGRARGPFLQSVRMGIYLLAGMASVWILLVWRRVWGRPGLLLGLGLTAMHLAALYFTYTRSIWLGVAISTLVIIWLTFEKRWRRISIVVMVTAALVVLGVMKGNFTSFKREYSEVETAQSVQMRTVFAYVSWLMIQDRPMTGHGFGHFAEKNRPYLNDRQTHLLLNSIRGYIHHNTFLSLLVEIGVIGFLLFMALLLAWFREAWRLWKSEAPDWARGHALFHILFWPFFMSQMMFHDVTYSPFENGLLFLLAGTTIGLTHQFAKQTLPWLKPFPVWSRQALSTGN